MTGRCFFCRLLLPIHLHPSLLLRSCIGQLLSSAPLARQCTTLLAALFTFLALLALFTLLALLALLALRCAVTQHLPLLPTPRAALICRCSCRQCHLLLCPHKHGQVGTVVCPGAVATAPPVCRRAAAAVVVVVVLVLVLVVVVLVVVVVGITTAATATTNAAGTGAATVLLLLLALLLLVVVAVGAIAGGRW